MIITYRKRLLMEDGVFVRTTNEQADIFHFNEGFLWRTLCYSHQDQQAWRTGGVGGTEFGPRERPTGGIWCLTQKNPSWSQRNNASRPEATERTVTHNVMAEVKVRSYCWQEKSKNSETLFMSAVETFQLFLNENLLLTVTPAWVSSSESGEWTLLLSDPGQTLTLQ